MIPPLKEHAFANEPEPWRERESLVLEHSLQVLLGDPARVSDFVSVDIEVDIGLDE